VYIKKHGNSSKCYGVDLGFFLQINP